MSEPVYTSQGATFDPTRVYRYSLWREWDTSRRGVLFVMLNPSTADEKKLDPTLRRCLGYAQRWSYGSFAVANLFALRSTDPRALKAAADPVGPENDATIIDLARRAGLVICGWGAHGGLRRRDDAVCELLSGVSDLHALRLTASGSPWHLLYLPGDLEPMLYRSQTSHRQASVRPRTRCGCGRFGCTPRRRPCAATCGSSR